MTSSVWPKAAIPHLNETCDLHVNFCGGSGETYQSENCVQIMEDFQEVPMPLRTAYCYLTARESSTCDYDDAEFYMCMGYLFESIPECILALKQNNFD